MIGEILGCDLGEVEGVIWALGSPAKSKGAIRSRSQMTKSKGVKSNSSRLWVHWRSRRVRSRKALGSGFVAWSGCDLSLSLRMSPEMV